MKFNLSFLKLVTICTFTLGVVHFSFAQYCSSSSTSASFCSTSLVSIGSLNNSSSGCANYSDYTSIYTELVLNGMYNLTIGLNNCSGFTMPKVSNVYIDWNGNEIFDVGEEVFHINATSAIAANQTNFSTTITVPANAVQDTIRMRVVTVWSTLDNANDYSCGMYGWGETEDYSLIIRGLIQNVSSVDNLCYGGNNGEINITTANTGSGLAYSIDGGLNFSTSPNFNNLSNGLYNVCVFDSLTNQAQCYSSNPVIIDSPDSLFAVTSIEDVSCFNGTDGSLNTEAFNGSPNYSYSWINGANTYNGNTVQNLSSGYYDLVVVDDNNCLFTLDSLFINQPNELIIDSVVTSSFQGYSISCRDGNNGFIEVYANGGTGFLSYNWDGNISNTSILQNLSAGDVSVVIFDANFCQKDTLINLSQPSALNVQTTVLHVGCENENDGSISANVTGGVAPYSIEVVNDFTNLSALNSNGQELFENLEVNSYVLSVIDLNHCLYEDTLNIENPTLSLVAENVTCFGEDDGQITYAIDFSTDIYNLITPSSTNNLAAGTYELLVQNDQGCFFDSTIIITEPDLVVIKESVEIICESTELANVVIEGAGGVMPYSIAWNYGDTIFNPSLSVGVYDFIFTDANGCTSTDKIEVLPPFLPELSYTLTTPSCEYNFDGSIDVEVAQGYPPFIYEWNDGKNESFIDSLPPKSYRLIVTDNAGCSSSLLEIVVPYVYNNCFYFPSAFTPNDDGINDTYEVSSIFSREPTILTIYNRQGNIIHQTEDTLSWDGKYKNQKCPLGKYYFHLQFANQYTTGEILLLE
jgi:gliding motility-associated-like protein